MRYSVIMISKPDHHDQVLKPLIKTVWITELVDSVRGTSKR